MKLHKILSLLLLVGMLLAACTPGSVGPTDNITPTTPPAATSTSAGQAATQSSSDQTPSAEQPPAALSAQKMLAEQLGIAVDQVKIVSAEQTQWNSGCLGLQKPDEVCTMIIVDGYKVILSANGKQYEIHTNNDGSQMRMAEGPAVSGTPVAPPTSGEVIPAVQAAQQTLAQQLGVNLADIKTVQVEQVEWPNGCLGVQMPGKMCTQMITPGYKVIFEVSGKQYEFHTDETGAAVLQAMAPLPQTADKLLVWEQTEGSVCSRIEIGPQGVAYGSCAGPLKEAQLQPNRAEELRYLMSTYQTFNSGTKGGMVQFNGQGKQTPTEAEMRSVAEWARLVNMEAQGGRGGAAWGQAFSWHREGGIAGFCDDLGVYLNGWAQPSTCKAGQAKSNKEYHLTADDLAQMYTWVDQFQNFEYSSQDAATTDAMKITLVFSGTGTEKANADQQKQIADFAAKVYSSAVR